MGGEGEDCQSRDNSLRNICSAEKLQNGVAGRRHEAKANTFLNLGN